MSFFVVDIEADGPIPAEYSMVCFGAILVTPELDTTFYGKLKPISDNYIPEALAVSGFDRGTTLGFPNPLLTMTEFNNWVNFVNRKGRPIFLSDNNGFDWQFINYYFHKFYGSNPFGFSSRRIADLFCGMQKDVYCRWKHLRKTKHTHNPVDDAKGNAEVILEMKKRGLRINI